MPRSAPYNRDVALGAAMSVFWEKGFHATSLKDLEGALEMKPGSIYAAFSSKSNLYLLALERYFEDSQKRFTAIMDAPASPLSALTGTLRSFANLPRDHEQAKACMLVKTLIDTRSTDAEIAIQAKRYISKLCEAIEAIFETAKQRGELPANADCNRLARRYQAAISALRFDLHRGVPAAQISDLAEDFAQEFERLRQSKP